MNTNWTDHYTDRDQSIVRTINSMNEHIYQQNIGKLKIDIQLLNSMLITLSINTKSK